MEENREKIVHIFATEKYIKISWTNDEEKSMDNVTWTEDTENKMPRNILLVIYLTSLYKCIEKQSICNIVKKKKSIANSDKL